ncbi:MAG: hypothetical protein J0H57_16630 [Rhodospirillales bacterium]|nr:hypothetical protein [Rhodospirillales bacterium]
MGSKRVGGSSGFTMAAPARKRQAVVKAAISSNASSLFGVDDDEEDGTAQSSSTEQQPMVRPRIKTYTAPKRNINSAASSSASLDEAQPDQPSQQQQQQQQQEYSSASVVLPEDLYEFARSIEPKLVRTMDLLAEFVTDNGIEYETLVRDRNKGDPRFRSGISTRRANERARAITT